MDPRQVKPTYHQDSHTDVTHNSLTIVSQQLADILCVVMVSR